MSRNYKEASTQKKPNAFNPLIGFIILLALGGLSYLGSGPVLEILTTTQLSHPLFGQLLPLPFPAEWGSVARQGLIGGALFAMGFILFIIVSFMFMTSAAEKDPTTVNLNDIRKEREAKEKERLKISKKAARQRRRGR